MVEPITIAVTESPAMRAAEILAATLAEATAERGSARVAIPGGSALAAVGRTRSLLGLAWRRLRLTWTDERCVPLDHADSNRGFAYRSGALSEADPAQYALPLFLDSETGGDAARRADAVLRARFDGGLDAVLLGIGTDGHIASLFSPASLPSGALALHVQSSPKPPPERITLTQQILATARIAVVLASGEAKRDALLRLLARDTALAASSLPRIAIVTDVALSAKENA